MSLITGLTSRTSRKSATVFEGELLAEFMASPYRGGGLLWIAADRTGRRAIRHQGRIPVPIGAPYLPLLLRLPSLRGVMVAGRAGPEQAGMARMRDRLLRIGRADLPVKAFFNDVFLDWLALTRGRNIVHRIEAFATVGIRPDRFYVILAAPRTGSTLLAELLYQAGISPMAAAEVFNNNRIRYARSRLIDGATMLDRYVNLHTSATGLCGMKMQGRHFADVMRLPCTGFPEAPLLPEAKVIRLVRRDRVAQVASYHRALRDGVWMRRRGDTLTSSVATRKIDAEADSDDALRRSWRLIRHEERLVDLAARRFFRPENVLPLAYEDMVADQKGAVAHIVAHLEIDPRATTMDSLHPSQVPMRNIYKDDLTERLAGLVG